MTSVEPTHRQTQTVPTKIECTYKLV